MKRWIFLLIATSSILQAADPVATVAAPSVHVLKPEVSSPLRISAAPNDQTVSVQGLRNLEAARSVEQRKVFDLTDQTKTKAPHVLRKGARIFLKKESK